MNLPVYGTPGDSPAERDGEWSVEGRLRDRAVTNLRRRAAFRTHLVVYLLVNATALGLWLVLWMAFGWWFPWPIFPLFGWGVGLGIHGWTAYRGDELSEDRIRAEMRRIMRD